MSDQTESQKWAEILPRRPISSTPAEGFSWLVFALGLAIAVLFSMMRDPNGVSMALAIVGAIVAAAGLIPALLLTGVRQIASRFRDSR